MEKTITTPAENISNTQLKKFMKAYKINNKHDAKYLYMMVSIREMTGQQDRNHVLVREE